MREMEDIKTASNSYHYTKHNTADYEIEDREEVIQLMIMTALFECYLKVPFTYSGRDVAIGDQDLQLKRVVNIYAGITDILDLKL